VISRTSAQSDSAIFFRGGVLEKGYSRYARTDFDAKYVMSNDVVPRKEVPFWGRETKNGFNIGRLESKRPLIVVVAQ